MSVHDDLENVETVDEVAEIAKEVSNIDDELTDIIRKVDDFKESFDDKTIQELRELINDLSLDLEAVKDRLY
jgi:hypothetical protein